MKISLSLIGWAAALPALVLTAASVGIHVWRDARSFQDLAASQQTPYFDTSWLRQPYTNYRLRAYPATERETMNAIGSERWLVREIKVGAATFWTVLRREPV